MSETIVYVRASKRDVVMDAVRQLPKVLASSSDPLAHGFRNGLGVAFLQKNSDNFIANSRGGSGADVDLRWPPLAPSTIAARRIETRKSSNPEIEKLRAPARQAKAAYREALKQRKLRGKFESKLYRRHVKTLIEQGMSPAHAQVLSKTHAHREAMFRFGDLAKRKVEVFAGVPVEILRDTGVGLNLLSPAHFSETTGDYTKKPPEHNPETSDTIEAIFENEPGQVMVGVRGYISRHHHGGRRLPKRSLWPDPMDWPDEWWNHMQDVSESMLVNVAADLARRAG